MTTQLMQTLAWSLLHLLWQGAAIAAVAAAIMSVLRKPETRYLAGVAALVLMLASFVITFSLLSGSSAADNPAAAGMLASASVPGAPAYSGNLLVGQHAASAPAVDFVWIARGWLMGVFVFALRMAFGLLVLEQLRRRNLVPLPKELVERFRAIQQRLGIRRAVRYCECHVLRVPAVIGVFRPVVLLPMRAVTGLTTEQLEAVIAHELGHIKRFDVAVNFFQVIAETLFFFHPAVWWLNKRIRADREDCCDDVAIAACGGTLGYARALATMEDWRDVPNFAMAATGSPVAARVARLLGVRQDATGSRAAGVVTASLVLATALIAGVISVGAANPAIAQMVAPADAPAPVAEVTPPPLPPTPPAAPAAPAPAREPAPPVPAVNAKSPREPKVSREPKAPREERVEREEKPPRTGSFIREMKSVGFEDLDVDTLIALKVQGVTPEYVREIRSSGFAPDANLFVAMKVHDITPDYIKQVRALGFKPDAGELIAMKSQGVTAEYVKGMRDLGINPDAGEFISMKVQGITPEYVRQIRSAGLTPNNQELIAMKVHDVTPEYRKALEAAGYELDVADTIAAKVMDITPEFIAKVRAGGFKNMTIDKLIQLKNADIL